MSITEVFGGEGVHSLRVFVNEGTIPFLLCHLQHAVMCMI